MPRSHRHRTLLLQCGQCLVSADRSLARPDLRRRRRTRDGRDGRHRDGRPVVAVGSSPGWVAAHAGAPVGRREDTRGIESSGAKVDQTRSPTAPSPRWPTRVALHRRRPSPRNIFADIPPAATDIVGPVTRTSTATKPAPTIRLIARLDMPPPFTSIDPQFGKGFPDCTHRFRDECFTLVKNLPRSSRSMAP